MQQVPIIQVELKNKPTILTFFIDRKFVINVFCVKLQTDGQILAQSQNKMNE